MNPQCRTLRLSGLKQKEVAEYLDRRLERPTPEQLVNHVHRRAGGNPLFMTAIVDHLESQHRSTRSWPADLSDLGVPDNIHAMIEQQIEELPESDQKILKLASVAGSHGFEFSSAALAAALEDQPGALTQDDIEEQCERLTRRINFLRAADVTRWSDGTTAASYTFGHALYQEVLYAMLSAGQRARAHLRVAQRLEKAYGAQAGRMAAELAMHFERGGDFRRAAEHLNGAADVAINRGAALEALRQTEKALQLLRKTPDENDRSRAELRLEATRQVALVSTGASAIEIQASVERMDKLAREIGIWAVQLLVVQGITKLNLSPSESGAAVSMIKAGLRQAEKGSKGAVDSELVPLQSIAHMALAIACNRNGEFRNAVAHAEKAVETYNAAYQPPSIDSRIVSIAEDANAQWFLGFPNKARENARQAIAAAEKISHAPALVYALARGATVFGMCRETEKALAIAERLVAFAADKDLPTMRWWGQFLRGAFRTAAGSADEGCRMMRSALAELDSPTERFRAGSTAHARAVLCFAEVEEGLLRPHAAFERLRSIIEECMQTGSGGMLSDIYRMIGLVKMAEEKINPRAPLEAECFFQKAIETAHAQNGKSLELRATLELARLWRRQDKGVQARKILTSIYRRFSEGHDTPDLEDAKALIAELG